MYVLIEAKGKYLDDLPALLGIPSVEPPSHKYINNQGSLIRRDVYRDVFSIVRAEFDEIDFKIKVTNHLMNPAERALAGLAGALLKRELESMADNQGVIARDTVELAAKTYLAAVRAGVNPAIVKLSWSVEPPRDSVRNYLSNTHQVGSLLVEFLHTLLRLFAYFTDGWWRPVGGSQVASPGEHLLGFAEALKRMADMKVDATTAWWLVRPIVENTYLAAHTASDVLGLHRVVETLEEAERVARHPEVKQNTRIILEVYKHVLEELSWIKSQSAELYKTFDQYCCRPQTHHKALREMARILEEIAVKLLNLRPVVSRYLTEITKMEINHMLKFIFAKG